MNNNFSNIRGHSRQIAALQRIIDGERNSGTFVFHGPQHIGKHTVALQFAAGLLGVAIDEIAHHPDVLLLSPIVRDSGARAYDVAQIRDALHRLGQSSLLGQMVLIIDDADILNRASQNALLKTLEEPNGNTVVILIAHDLSALLPTIQSRAVAISFFGTAPEGSEELQEDARRMTSRSLVERLKVAQELAKREEKDWEGLWAAMTIRLHNDGRVCAHSLEAILQARDRLRANANSTVALTELAVQLDQYE